MTQQKDNNDQNENQSNILWPPADYDGQNNLFGYNDTEGQKDNNVIEEGKTEENFLAGVNKEIMREVMEEETFGMFSDNNTESGSLRQNENEYVAEENIEEENSDNNSLFFGNLTEDVADVQPEIDEQADISENGARNNDTVEVQKSKLELVKQLVANINESSRRISELLDNTISEEDAVSRLSSIIKNISETEDEEDGNGKIIEGVFNGQCMIGPDGKQYNMPSNYASKSKLVEGDILKLTISPVGKFIYKQIGPIERSRVVGTLGFDDAQFLVENEGKKWKILTASVTYFKGKAGDEAVILVPKHGESTWAAVENIISRNA